MSRHKPDRCLAKRIIVIDAIKDFIGDLSSDHVGS